MTRAHVGKHETANALHSPLYALIGRRYTTPKLRNAYARRRTSSIPEDRFTNTFEIVSCDYG